MHLRCVIKKFVEAHIFKLPMVLYLAWFYVHIFPQTNRQQLNHLLQYGTVATMSHCYQMYHLQEAHQPDVRASVFFHSVFPYDS